MDGYDTIDVAIPAYNAARSIVAAMDSCVNQTYKGQVNVIVVNDGSSDDTDVICREYCQRVLPDNRSVIYVEQENGGVSVARNRLVQESKGDWIFFLDSDDYVSGTILDNLMNTIQRTGMDIATTAKRVMMNGEKVTDCLMADGEQIYTVVSAIEQFLLPSGNVPINIAVAGKLFRRHLFDDVVFPEGVVYEDTTGFFDALVKSDGIAHTGTCEYFNCHFEDKQNITLKAFSKNAIDKVTQAIALMTRVNVQFPTLQNDVKKFLVNEILSSLSLAFNTATAEQAQLIEQLLSMTDMLNDHQYRVLFPAKRWVKIYLLRQALTSLARSSASNKTAAQTLPGRMLLFLEGDRK